MKYFHQDTPMDTVGNTDTAEYTDTADQAGTADYVDYTVIQPPESKTMIFLEELVSKNLIL